MQEDSLKKQVGQSLELNDKDCSIYSFGAFKQEYKNHQAILNDFENQVEDIVCFLTSKAEEFDERGIAKTFLYINERDQEIIGFFTLKIKGLLSESLCLSNEMLKKLNGGYGSKVEGNILNFYLIGQLGVAKKYQGQKLGKKLLAVAIDIIYETQNNVGGRYILVDALKSEQILNFYRSFGFRELRSIDNEETLTMIAPIKSFFNKT